jgi:ParB family chromosome partitioning protein
VNEKRRALGRGLGALIPTSSADRPVDVFFPRAPAVPAPDPEAEPRGSAAGDPPQGGASPPAGASPAPAAGEVPDNAGAAADGAAGHDQDGLLPVPGARFAELPVDAIGPNPRQPRTVFDADELAELVHSVREIGILQPVVVRPLAPTKRDDDPDAGGRAGGTAGGDATAERSAHDEASASDDLVRFELVMGERRWRAAREAGLATVPAIIRTTADEDLLRDALLENLHRSQLNPLEEAAAYRQLLDDFGCSQEELATRIGRSRPQVTNTLRLLRLPPLVQRRVAAGVLSAGHARALLGLDDAGAMERLAQRIVAEGLSVRSAEEIVALGATGQAKPRKPRPGARRPQLEELAARLSDRFETRVALSLGQRRGKLVLEFASVEDLNRILAVMGVEDWHRDRPGPASG